MESGIEIVIRSVRTVCPDLTDHELSLFASKLAFKELKKKELFVHAGNIQKVIGFIVQGLVRSSYIDFDGNEITVGFYQEGDYATHYPAFISRKPNSYSIQCLEPTLMACLSYEDLQWIYGQSAGFERYGRLVTEEILKRQQACIESFIFQTAETRYLDFMDQQPALFNRSNEATDFAQLVFY